MSDGTPIFEREVTRLVGLISLTRPDLAECVSHSELRTLAANCLSDARAAQSRLPIPAAFLRAFAEDA